MEQNLTETAHSPDVDTKAIDAWLKSLWDKVKKAAELIGRLRAERAELLSRVASLEEELVRVRQDLVKHEEIVRSISVEHRDGGRSLVSNAEHEELRVRVKDLLTRLEGYL